MNFVLATMTLFLAIVPPSATRQYHVVVFDDGTVSGQAGAGDSAEAVGEQGQRGKRPIAVWSWTDTTPPKRHSPHSKAPVLDPAKLRWMTLQVTCVKPLTEATTIIAAPVPMWDEVPENVLPRWTDDGRTGDFQIPVTRDQPWRMKAFTNGYASWWLDASPRESRIALPMERASEVSVILRAGSVPARHSSLVLLRPEAGNRKEVIARFSGTEDRIVVGRVPDGQSLTVMISSDDTIPVVLQTYLNQLPKIIVGSAGSRIAGSVVDAKGRPIPKARVTIEAWTDRDAFAVFRRNVTTDTRGRWLCTRLPASEAVILAQAEGYISVRRTFRIVEEFMLVDPLILIPGRSTPVQVVHDAGGPASGVTIESQNGKSVTDRRGRATVIAAAIGATALKVSGPGYLASTVWLPSSAPEAVPVVHVQRAYTVHGLVHDSSGLPVMEGIVRVVSGLTERTVPLRDNGTLNVDLPAGSDAQIVISTSNAAEKTILVPAGQSGDHVDLGVVQLDDGFALTGSVYGDEGAPVRAHVWVPKETGKSAVAAWSRGAVSATTSAVDGTFTLRGVPKEAMTLRVDSAGYARGHVAVDAGRSTNSSIGSITLMRGGSLRVLTDKDAPDLVARVDLRSEGQDFDFVSSSPVAGSAAFDHITRGSVTVTVLKGNRLACENTVIVEDGETVDVDCRSAPITVSGRVMLGHNPANAGTLTWSPLRKGEPTEAVIMKTVSPLGAASTHIYGASCSPVLVPIDERGAFTTDSLIPGMWRVALTSASGGQTEPKNVMIPVDGAHDVSFIFPGAEIAGQVVSESGAAVAGARVQEQKGEAVAISNVDGYFALVVTPGEHLISAKKNELSDTVRVEVKDEATQSVRLTLRPLRASLSIKMRNSQGDTIADGFVFLQTATTMKILTPGADGIAFARFEEMPERVRLAGFSKGRWIFTDWLRATEGEQLVLSFVDVGSLQIEGSDDSYTLLAESGWDVTNLLRTIGVPVGAGHKQMFDGLPAAHYVVVTPRRTLMIVVKKNEVANLRF